MTGGGGGNRTRLPIDNTEVTDFRIGRIGTNGIIGDFIARVLHAAIYSVWMLRGRVFVGFNKSFVASYGGGRILGFGSKTHYRIL